MEFGRIENINIANVDFELPDDSALTTKTLAGSASNGDVNIYVGCPKWGHPAWVGTIYPPKTKPDQFLNEYSKQFNSIELNATFYVTPKSDQVKRWNEQVDGRPDFKFCPRFPQSITHIKRLKNAELVTAEFYESISSFGDKLGALLLQLGDNFTPKSFDDLKLYLETLPKEIPVFVEVRHRDWFSDQEARHKLFNTFHDLKIGTVITDTAGRRDCAHMELTTPHAMIRFVANDLHPTDYTRVDAWVQRIKSWKEKGLQTLWFFVHVLDENHIPEMANYIIKQLNNELGTNLIPPKIIDK